MKYFLTVCSLFLFSQISFADPFGVSMGMKLEALKVLEDLGDGLYTITVPKSHRFFDEYRIYAGKEEGVCVITARSKLVITSGYGSELLSEFNQIETTLNKIYGKNKRFNFLRIGSIWDAPRDWVTALLKKERTLAVFWDKEKGSKLKNDIQEIVLIASALSRDKGLINIDYIFSNHKKCKEEISKEENELL